MATLKKPAKEAGSPPMNVLTGDIVGGWCKARVQMEPEFVVARALRGGTQSMRYMADVFLPRTIREQQQATEYVHRLRRTFLHPGYSSGVEDIASKPFQRPVTLTEPQTLDEGLQRIEQDADRNGTPLTEFAAQVFEAAIDRGAAGILVDFPPVIPGGTAADDITKDRRPFFRLVKHDDLLSWGWERDASDRDALAYVAVYSELERVDTAGKLATVQRVTYWTAKEWQVWEREDPAPNRPPQSGFDLVTVAESAPIITQGTTHDAYKPVAEGTHPCGTVPYVPVVLTRYGRDPLSSRPCLHAVAWKNVDHWQISSDRRNVLHYSGAPMIVGSGVEKGTEEDPIAVGAGAQILSTNPDTKLGYVEPAGTSAEVLKQRDLELVDQMTALAMAPLMRVSNKTATGVEADEKTAQSKAQTWAERLEWGIFNAYEVAQCWIDEGKGDLPEEFDVAVFRDFSLRARAADELRVLGEARGRKDVSRETWLREAVERGLLVTVDDVDEELERIEEEGESMAALLPSFGAFGKTAEGPDDAQPDPEEADPKESKAPPVAKKPPPRQAASA